MKKILIIGKRGFIGKNLTNYLKKFYFVSQKSFKNFNQYKSIINKFDYVINTSINQKYIKEKYNFKNDNDLTISNFIKNKKTTFVFLSTRKVYKSKSNIKENSKLLPKTNYAKNKLRTEKKLISILTDNLIILRISNLIGDKRKVKTVHNTFIDVFFQNIQKGFILENNRDFKDFISIQKFCEIVKNIINKDLRGIFNVSIGKKIYLNDVIKWLNKFNKKKVKIEYKKLKDDCFFLNNKKLMSKIKIKNTEQELKKFCIEISKKRFS